MANRRRGKKRKSTCVRAQEHDQNEMSEAAGTTSTMSTERKSSDAGMSSNARHSEEGTYTEMTSVMGSEEHVGTTTSGVLETEDAEIELGSDGQSTFAAPSEYPAISDAHRSEMPYDDDDDVDMLSTRSITEQDLDYRWENGRRYCGPHYMWPNDDYEQVRLSLIHRIYLDIFDGKLTTAPLSEPERVLDIGTGTGEWAIGMSDAYPDCEVIGTDISAIQPTSVPANCFFEIDDAELEWTREPDSFDLVHFRDTMGSFADWHFLYDEAYRVIKPGGWIELVDFDDSGGGLKKFVSQFPPTSDIHAYVRDMHLATQKSGRARGVAHLNPAWLHQAGFVDIKVTEHIVPINIEAGGGKLWLIAMVDGFEAMSLRLLTQQMGWDPERVREACYNIAREMTKFAKDPVRSKGMNIRVKVVVGRKPVEAGPRRGVAREFDEEVDAAREVITHEDGLRSRRVVSPGPAGS